MCLHYLVKLIAGLLDQYLPYIKVTKYTADKPRVTQQLKDVIHQRQRALLSSNRQEYSRLRNRAGRMSKSLRQKYYQKKVQALHEADSHSWWKRTKQFLSVSDTDPLQHLDVPTGQSLADAINTYFVRVCPMTYRQLTLTCLSWSPIHSSVQHLLLSLTRLHTSLVGLTYTRRPVLTVYTRGY